ncbi:ATP-binding protein [uncultured Corynebacterium sp.]|uniref:AAA family ATPase n=1 Tax=uncultured Corynebacterium sp. TaxID=159447 RepID=UPI0025FD8A44|nr:ATP-binding protein [uncultured Corynebacterium sp.]
MRPTPRPRNPFRPTFGVSPHVLAGREPLLADFELALAEGPGSPYRSILVSGARGIGKTVLLNELEDVARGQGWVIARAHVGAALIGDLVDTTLPGLISDVADEPPRRAITGASVTGIGSINVSAPTDDRPAPTLIARLRELSAHLRARGTGVLVTVDEVQSADSDAIHELATAYQDLVRDDFDVAFAAAGLPHGIDELLQRDGTTFLRRAERLDLGPVERGAAIDALRRTAADGGRDMDADAAADAADLSRGYPYLIQLVGSLAWAQASLGDGPAITSSDVAAIRERAIDRMGAQVHRPSLRGVPDGERIVLEAMADLMAESGEDSVATGDIAARLEMTPQGLSPRRARLLERELVRSPKFGYLTFALPYLGEHLRDNR